MRAIVLAAGRGSRMRALTGDRPKCLVEVGGRPLIEWQMEALHGAGIPEIALVKGYRADTLERYTGYFNARWGETNMVRSLECASEWLREGPCIVSYSDILYPVETVRALAAQPGEIALTYDRKWLEQWSRRFEDPLSDAETFRVDARGRVVEIGNRPRTLDDVQGQYMGLLKFRPAGWRQVEANLAKLDAAAHDRLDMTSLLRGLIAGGAAVEGVPVDGRFFEVDSDADLAHAEAYLTGHGGVL